MIFNSVRIIADENLHVFQKILAIIICLHYAYEDGSLRKHRSVLSPLLDKKEITHISIGLQYLQV
jgi:hypothetical protein